jgi:2-phospho-L-lactate guanylyltransferase
MKTLAATLSSAAAPGLTVLIPVRSLDDGKRRLANMLTPDERRLMVEAMLRDVVAAAQSCDRISSIVVVTDDDDAANLARRLGAAALSGIGPIGYSRTVALAVNHLRESNPHAIIVIPADVPLVTADELSTVAAAVAAPGAVALVEADPDGGTNCIGLSAFAAVEFQFGACSFRRHVESIRGFGQTPLQLHLPGLTFDVDWPEQLVDLAEMPGTTHASKLARDLNVAARRSPSAKAKSTLSETQAPCRDCVDEWTFR